MKDQNVAKLGNCNKNPKCCYHTHDLECPSKFNPPLLSTSTEFCTEALTKGIPIPKCVLAKPKKLQIEREPPPLAKPATARHLKNWRRWCYIWRQTYNNLTAQRDTEIRPPVMGSGESEKIKKEDKELFERTLHSYHLTGFYVKSAQFPAAIKSDKEVTEAVTKRHIRDFPEMKRDRYSNYVRNEVSVPARKIVQTRRASRALLNRSPGFNFDDQWTKTSHVVEMKDALACDIGLYGKTNPIPDGLILKQLHIADGPSEKIMDRNQDKNKKGRTDLAIPQLVFSMEEERQDEDSAKGRDSMSQNDAEDRKSSYYSEQRGPILRVHSQFSEVIMTFSKPGVDFPHFIGNPAASFALSDGDGTSGNAYFYDDDHHFSITPKCKETKLILLKNEGTTTIRYQWFRFPPTYDAQQMLENPSNFKHIRLETDESQQEVNELDSNNGETTTASHPDGNSLKRVSKKPHLEFHFCSLPGAILPGQSLEFPIIFRSKRPGFFHETLYLLTHPRVVSLQDGKSYAVRLSGVCTDIELAEKGNEQHEMERLKQYLKQRAMEEETVDLMDSIIDRALWESTNPTANGSSLPHGRVTAESIFCAHNKDYYYHFGKSEKAVELVRLLVEMLVPRERVETQAQATCDLSLQNLYDLVMKAREEKDLYWDRLRSSECEDLLEQLNTECMHTLVQQRTFAWPITERRKYTACYSDLVGTIDEILAGFDRLHSLYNAPAIKLIDGRTAQQMTENFIKAEQMKDEERMQMLTTTNGSREDVNGMFRETNEDVYGDLPRLTDPPLEIGNATGSNGMPPQEENDEVASTQEDVPYWLAAFEEIMSLFTPLSPQLSQESKPRKQQQGEKMGDEQQEQSDNEIDTTDTGGTRYATSMVGVGSSGDAPPTPSTVTAPGERRRESKALTLEETMVKQVGDSRKQLMTESKVRLFEDMMCAGIERMLTTVDNFNNMLDYKDTDALVVIDNKC